MTFTALAGSLESFCHRPGRLDMLSLLFLRAEYISLGKSSSSLQTKLQRRIKPGNRCGHTVLGLAIVAVNYL